MGRLAREGHRANAWVIGLSLVLATSALAQERGFRLHRYEGTAPGGWLFMVERPWYSGERYFAVGLSADYSHRALESRFVTAGGISPIVEHALVGHVGLAGSLFDRVRLSASMPVALLERGTTESVSQVGPLSGIGLGDPRAALMVRLFGQAERDAISLHLGADVWLPIGGAATHQGDTSVRVLPRLVAAGAFGLGRWSVDAAFLYRPYASYGPPLLGMTAASELRLGVSLGALLANQRLHIGPEAQYSVQVVGANAFAINGMSLELLGGLQYLIGDHVLIGVAGGTGLFGAAGTPDARAMVRLAWAPHHPLDDAPRDRADDTASADDESADDVSDEALAAAPVPSPDDADGDGISDAKDRCPFEPETKNRVRDADGCPEYELEPGAPLTKVLAKKPAKAAVVAKALPIAPPTAPVDAGTPDAGAVAVIMPDAGLAPDAGVALAVASASAPTAFATADADGDGVPDEADRCPVTPEDPDGFEDEDGCPELDNDGDGVPDAKDQCAVEAETVNGIKDDDGCPDVAEDADKDSVADVIDRCPFEPENVDGVRDEDGCPELKLPASEGLAHILTAPAPDARPGRAASTEEPEAAPLSATDSDGDGVPDDADRCPVTPEDRDGFEDEDGCPEPDNDDDGVADAVDRCPEVAETMNGFEDQDGCPEEHPDVDGDGLDYAADRCPFEPGTALDGCPHEPPVPLALPGFVPKAATAVAETAPEAPGQPAPTVADYDHDGASDEVDRCPVSSEDGDGFEDEDGCPEPDNDRDGVADATDKCPLEAETINGAKDDDGCPDVGAGVVAIKGDAVVIKGTIQFKPASATLQPSATPLLKQVASTLRAASTVSVEIQGHTDDTGSAVKNIALSKKRAETIRAFLVKAGVAANRLVANGYGPQRPRASNKTAAGREQNRRVEFLILGEAQ